VSDVYVPQFLYVSFSAWIFFFLLFLASYNYLRKVPDEKILEYEPKTISVKKKLGISIYKF